MSNIVVDKSKVPWWVSNVIVPLVNLTLALLVSGLFVFIAGENPIEAVKLIIYGSFGYIQGFAYTLLHNKFYFYWASFCCSLSLQTF